MNIETIIESRKARLHFMSIPQLLSDWFDNKSVDISEAEQDNKETDTQLLEFFTELAF